MKHISIVLLCCVLIFGIGGCNSKSKKGNQDISTTTTTTTSNPDSLTTVEGKIKYLNYDDRKAAMLIAKDEYANVLVVDSNVYIGEISDVALVKQKSPLEMEWDAVYQLCMKNRFQQEFEFAGLGQKYVIGTILNAKNIVVADLRDYMSEKEFAFVTDTSELVSCDIGYVASKGSALIANAKFNCAGEFHFKLDKNKYDSAIVNTGGYILTEILLNKLSLLSPETRQRLRPYYEIIDRFPQYHMITRTINVMGFDAELYLDKESQMVVSLKTNCPNSVISVDASDSVGKKKQAKVTASCSSSFTAFVQLWKLRKVEKDLPR